MNYLIDFFESLKFDKTMSNLEFSNENEQLNITKNSTAYLFYFTKVSPLFKTNLCQEIMLITEDNADLKLDFNNTLAEYLQLKLQNKSVEGFIKSSKIEIPQNFISQFEEKLTTYNNFNYIYLTLKINSKYPEPIKFINKNKI